MVRTEFYRKREDGVTLVRSYSDAGLKIQQYGTGIMYDDVIDPENMGRTYTETDEPIEQDRTAEEVLAMLEGAL